jgi:hypothetical protein
MKILVGPAVVLLTVVVGTSVAPAVAGELLSPERLRTELGGQTIKGYYVRNRVNFVEIYQSDGRITYKDDHKGDAGRWSIQGSAFCTFYDQILGGCWSVIKHSANCLEFYPAEPNGREDVTQEMLLDLQPTARAARDSDKVTCDTWFGS